MSGTPRNEFLGLPADGALAFLQPRGSVGRTGAVFDANVRFTYALRPWGNSGPRPALFLDLFEVGNRRTPLLRDEHYGGLDDDGNPTLSNPNYGGPLVFQTPMSARLGISMDFGAEP